MDIERRPIAQPEYPAALPPELAEFLRAQEVACLMHGTDQGTAYVVKLPRTEIVSLRGRVPVRVRHELYARPTAPVIRTIITIYDQPASPLALETFTNIEDTQQQAELAALAEQDRFLMLFYDEQLLHCLTKAVVNEQPADSATILAVAQRILAQIPRDRFDFEQAKQEVLDATQM